MEVLNISLDDNTADTSHDELDEDPDYKIFFSTPRRKRINREVISGHEGDSSKMFKGWERPSVPDGSVLYSCSPLQSQPDEFRFLFLDSVSSISSIKHPSIVREEQELKNAPWHTVIRLFGVTRIPGYAASQDLFDEPDFMNPKFFSKTDSISVCCNVHGFIPYFYSLPTTEYFEGSELFDMVNSLRTTLNQKVSHAILQDMNLVEVHEFITDEISPVVSIEVLQLGNIENSIFYFPSSKGRNKNSVVLKIHVALPMFVSTTAKILDELKEPYEFQNFETALTNNIRFLTDQNIPGCTWLELKAGKYFQRVDHPDVGLELESYSQIEIDVHFKDIIKIPEQPKDIPPLRILSFDLETRVKENGEPTDGWVQGQIIQIGVVLSSYGTPGDPVIGKAVFVLGTCDPLPNTKVLQFYDKNNPANNTEGNLVQSEVIMLASFRDFVVQMDPDIITGYNIKNFDLPFMIERAEKFIHEFEEVKRFPFLGRLKKVKTSVRPIINKNKRMYQFDNHIVNIQGRIVMDMYPLYVLHDTKRSGRYSLKLKAVAKRYLKTGEEKDDVKYTEINSLQNGNSQTRRRLAKYCVQDAYLPIKLMLVQMPDRAAASQDFVEHYFGKSHLGGTLLRHLFNKSREYNKYFKHVRVQKNDGRVKYYPDSPNPKKLQAAQPKTKEEAVTIVKPCQKSKTCNRMLFTDDD